MPYPGSIDAMTFYGWVCLPQDCINDHHAAIKQAHHSNAMLEETQFNTLTVKDPPIFNTAVEELAPMATPLALSVSGGATIYGKAVIFIPQAAQ